MCQILKSTRRKFLASTALASASMALPAIGQPAFPTGPIRLGRRAGTCDCPSLGGFTQAPCHRREQTWKPVSDFNADAALGASKRPYPALYLQRLSGRGGIP